MKCTYHQDKEATEYCASCKTPLCDPCAIPHNGKVLCSRCIALEAAKETVNGIDERLEEKKRQTSMRQGRKRLKKRLWYAAQWAIVVIGLCVMAYKLPDLIRVLKEDKPLRNGAYETDAKTDDCIRTLWRMARLLQEGKRPGTDLVCPETGSAYVVTTREDDIVVSCPNPGAHGFSAINVSRKHPVPEVIK